LNALRILLPVLALTVTMGCGRRADKTALVQPDAYKSYVRANQALISQPPRTDDAIALLESMLKDDPGNAMNHYGLAACFARQGNWDKVQQYLDSGNAAPRCRHYIWEGPYRPTPLYAAIRSSTDLMKQGGAAMDPNRAAAMFESVRGAGAKLMESGEPHETLGFLVGLSLWLRGQKWAEVSYRRAGRASEADEARRLFDAVTTWGKDAKSRLKALQPRILAASMKYFAQQQAVAYIDGKEPETADIPRLQALRRETEDIEGSVLSEVLPRMPR
jgi:hypothetical protein